jgi:hypothetical protein
MLRKKLCYLPTLVAYKKVANRGSCFFSGGSLIGAHGWLQTAMNQLAENHPSTF